MRPLSELAASVSGPCSAALRQPKASPLSNAALNRKKFSNRHSCRSFLPWSVPARDLIRGPSRPAPPRTSPEVIVRESVLCNEPPGFTRHCSIWFRLVGAAGPQWSATSRWRTGLNLVRTESAHTHPPPQAINTDLKKIDCQCRANPTQ